MSEKVLIEQDKKVLNEIAKASWRHRKNAGGWVKVRSFNELEKYSPAVAKKLITPVIASRLATEKRCKLVPVRLASESVNLKKLEEWLKEVRDKMPNEHDKAIVSQVTGFILGKEWAEKEAKKK